MTKTFVSVVLLTTFLCQIFLTFMYTDSPSYKVIKNVFEKYILGSKTSLMLFLVASLDGNHQ